MAVPLRGGEWLLKATDPATVLTPERLTEEHRLIAQTVSDFVRTEVLPVHLGRLPASLSSQYIRSIPCRS